SRTRCGSHAISTLSLALAGSPSVPLAITTGRSRPAATARSLRAVGKLAPPRPVSPARPASAISSSCHPAPEPPAGGWRADPLRATPRAGRRGRCSPGTRGTLAGPHGPGRLCPRPRLGPAATGPAEHPGEDGRRHRRGRAGLEQPHPPDAEVAAGGERVQEGGRPGEVAEPVHGPPGTLAKAPPE